jgi:hypothetical protein
MCSVHGLGRARILRRSRGRYGDDSGGQAGAGDRGGGVGPGGAGGVAGVRRGYADGVVRVNEATGRCRGVPGRKAGDCPAKLWDATPGDRLPVSERGRVERGGAGGTRGAGREAGRFERVGNRPRQSRWEDGGGVSTGGAAWVLRHLAELRDGRVSHGGSYVGGAAATVRYRECAADGMGAGAGHGVRQLRGWEVDPRCDWGGAAAGRPGVSASGGEVLCGAV